MTDLDASYDALHAEITRELLRLTTGDLLTVTKKIAMALQAAEPIPSRLTDALAVANTNANRALALANNATRAMTEELADMLPQAQAAAWCRFAAAYPIKGDVYA